MVRCVRCGCSRWDPEGCGCALCGGSPARRGEPVHVTFDTKATLLASAEELKAFGVCVEHVEQHRLLRKVMGGPVQGSGIVLSLEEPLNPDTRNELVCYLKYVGLPEEEVLLLRLGEPKDILAHYRAPA